MTVEGFKFYFCAVGTVPAPGSGWEGEPQSYSNHSAGLPSFSSHCRWPSREELQLLSCRRSCPNNELHKL